jgi:hypothetical protein
MARADLHVCVRWKRKSSECGQRSLFLLARDVQIFSPMNQPLWGGLASGQARLETNPDVYRLLRTLRDHQTAILALFKGEQRRQGRAFL